MRIERNNPHSAASPGFHFEYACGRMIFMPNWSFAQAAHAHAKHAVFYSTLYYLTLKYRICFVASLNPPLHKFPPAPALI